MKRWGDGGPLVIGHRGAMALERENTLASFRRARADGADGVELDVQRCATGEIIVFHDEDLDRLCGRPGRVDALPLAALRELGLPTLDEVLEEVGPLLVNVELKVPMWRTGRRLAAAVAERLRRHGSPERVLVSSFHPVGLACFRALSPGTRTGLIFGDDQARWLREAWSRGPLGVAAVHPQHTLVDAASMTRWAAEGRLVHTWTVDDPAEVTRLAALGVHALITNDPAATRRRLAGAQSAS